MRELSPDPAAEPGVADVTERREAEARRLSEDRRIEHLIEGLPMAAWVLDRDQRSRYANRRWLELFGPVEDSCKVLRVAGTDAPYPVERLPSRRAFHGEDVFVDDIEVLRPDGSRARVEAQAGRVFDERGDLVHVVVVVRDVAERVRRERVRDAARLVAQALASSATLAEAAQRILQAVCEAAGATWGALWVVDATADVLRCSDTWRGRGAALDEYERVSRASTFARGQGIAGRVWHTGEPAWISDVGETAQYVRAQAAVSAGLRNAYVLPIRVGGEVTAVMEVAGPGSEPPSEELLSLLTTTGAEMGQLAERKRVDEASARYRDAMRAMEVAIEVQEAERSRIARELHDETGQALITLQVWLRALAERTGDGTLREELHALRALTTTAIAELGRLVRGLHPSVLDRLGFETALRQLGAELARAHGLTVDVEVRVPRGERIQPALERALYRGVQEALTNVVRHAAARRARVAVAQLRDVLQITVEDDGRGFDLSRLGGSGLGLPGMRDRVERFGGTLAVRSRLGQGTTVVMRVPHIGDPEGRAAQETAKDS